MSVVIVECFDCIRVMCLNRLWFFRVLIMLVMLLWCLMWRLFCCLMLCVRIICEF